MSNRRVLWDAAFVLIALISLTATFRLYRFFEPTLAHHSFGSISVREADKHIESAKAYIDTHPDDYKAWTSLSIAYYSKGPEFYDKGLNALDKARNLGANDEQLFYYAGVMFDVLGLPDYAMVELSKYLHHHPNDYETCIRLANIYFKQKHTDEAMALYKQIIHEWPKDPTIWYNYALLNKEKQNWAVALTSLAQVRKLAGQMPEGGLYLEGEIYRLQGQEDKAVQSYQQELVKFPNSLPALEALDMMARHHGDRKQSREFQKRIQELKKQAKAAA